MITRRAFATSLFAVPAIRAAQARTNFIVIYADDLGYGDLGVYGHPTIRTPNLDRMAAEGARFTQFYSAAPVCSPSRAALLTGRYPVRSGVTKVLFPDSAGGLPDSEVTIAETLKNAGYRTACVGKWHLGHRPQYLPLRHGFDSYFGIPYSNDMTPTPGPGAPGNRNHPPLPLVRNEQTIETEPDQSRLTERYTAECVNFIRAPRGNPFFLYYPQTFPHVPLYAGARFRGKSPRGLYGDVVEEIDWSVGEILRTLKETGQDNNTLVIFSSDNGPWLIKKELGGSAGLLREGKATTWDGGMREPFIARWPGRIPAGRVSQTFASTLDVLPTIASLAGAKLPAGLALDGTDISGALTGSGDAGERPFYYWNVNDLRAVRQGRWKLHVGANNVVDSPTGIQKLDAPLLYDLLTDPSEQYDVAKLHPDIVARLKALLLKHEKSVARGTPQT